MARIILNFCKSAGFFKLNLVKILLKHLILRGLLYFIIHICYDLACKHDAFLKHKLFYINYFVKFTTIAKLRMLFISYWCNFVFLDIVTVRIKS